MRAPRLALALLLAASAASGEPPARAGGARSETPASQVGAARRVVSMNPSLTETLVALGAAHTLVGVDEDSRRRLPAVRDLPTVGGLFNPSLEAIVALEPDLVVMVPSAEQRGLGERLQGLGVAVLALPNIRLEELLESIDALGARVGRAEAARARVAAIRDAWREVSRASAGRRALACVLVLQRDPLYVVGSGSWIDAMLGAAGVENLGAALQEPFPRASQEWLIAAAPELLLDATEGDPQPARFWQRWPSLPAVGAGRVLGLDGDWIRPGPYLDRSLRELAAMLDGVADAP